MRIVLRLGAASLVTIGLAAAPASGQETTRESVDGMGAQAVSYTHLTLPTILRV